MTFKMPYNNTLERRQPCEHMKEYVEKRKRIDDDNILIASEDPYCSLEIGCKKCDFAIYLEDAQNPRT